MQNNFSSSKYTMIVVILLAQIFHQQIMAQTNDLHTFKGVTEPVNEAILSSSVDGTIKEILVKEGDWVKKGDPLIRLYRKEQELEVALRYKLWKNTISLEAARIKEKNILELYTASKKLFDKSRSISKEELTRLRIQYDQSQLNRLELEIREEQERIQYEIAKENLARRVLNAPKSGVVTKVFFIKVSDAKPIKT
ncbi:MAG: Membrane-fusion protein-like protein [Candidatus Magnetoglobus multicellularis str. Araruama]|uniref:Membrane-fusion protein-like protein n=1 Tax=Candidatus Magnetoglobus multicellularis str. Araruama TaxID=890399 RepID=A0A1V1P479_9BACT|nr:MAG: Membrane-fusion protein-like protein [Candidatus Magnetoglobus multicellularis str. Araruama]